MGSCKDCATWFVRRETGYDNGETVIKWQDPQGRGRCRGPLNGVLVPPDFGCNAFASGGPIVERDEKPGEPWHYWSPVPCPDCRKLECGFEAPGMCVNAQCPGTNKCLGRGMNDTNSDFRCVGTGTVRYYDDGYIGDNRTCAHPKEAVKRDDVQPTCSSCKKDIDLSWMACPYCGNRLKEQSGGELTLS
jgi:hypothetical protein